MPGPILPQTPRQRLTWFEARIQSWIENQEFLQLGAEQVAEIDALVQSAAARLEALDAARVHAQGLTQQFYSAIDSLLAKGRIAIKEIKVTAEQMGDDDICSVAGLPLPSERRRLKQPAVTIHVAAHLTTGGTVQVKWDIPRRGAWDGQVYFIVERRLDTPFGDRTATDWVTIGTSHNRRFHDENVPIGWGQAQYRIIAARNGYTSGASAETVVAFGNVRGAVHRGPATCGAGRTAAA